MVISKKKSYLIIGIVDFTLFIYFVILVLGLLKFYGHDDDLIYKITFTNEIINSTSSISEENTFKYEKTGEIDKEIIAFSSSGDSVSIGTYDPQSYIFGTEDKDLIISFKLENKKVNKVEFNDIRLSDSDGYNIYRLSKDTYRVFKEDDYYKVKYSSTSPKYVYSVSLSYYISR